MRGSIATFSKNTRPSWTTVQSVATRAPCTSVASEGGGRHPPPWRRHPRRRPRASKTRRIRRACSLRSAPSSLCNARTTFRSSPDMSPTASSMISAMETWPSAFCAATARAADDVLVAFSCRQRVCPDVPIRQWVARDFTRADASHVDDRAGSRELRRRERGISAQRDGLVEEHEHDIVFRRIGLLGHAEQRFMLPFTPAPSPRAGSAAAPPRTPRAPAR